MGQLILIGIGIIVVCGIIAAITGEKSEIGGFLILAVIVGGIGLMFSPIAAFVAFAVIVFLCGD